MESTTTAVAPLRIGVIGVGPDRPDARRAHRPPGPGRGARRRVRRAPPSARDVADELGVPAAASVEEILDGDLDAVAICSSSDTHVDLLIAAAEAGKAVFCEKPVSLDLAELDRALDAVEAAGVPFQIGFNRRFDPGPRLGREAVAAGAIGEPHLVRISSRDPEPPPLDYIKTLRRPVPGHDDPRLRHGAVRHRQRGGRGVRARRGAGRPVVRARPATSTPRWSRSCTRTAA